MVDQCTDFYVYAYKDPNTLEPFYIGKGLKDRASMHLHEAKNPKHTPENYYNPYKLNKIRQIIDTGNEPVIEKLYVDLTEEEAFSYEVSLIEDLGRVVDGTGILTNLTSGGEGFSGVIRDKEEYHIINVSTGEERYATQYQMHRELGLYQAGACYLVSGNLDVSNGWRMYSNDSVSRMTYVGQTHNFINAYTLETRECTQKELIDEFNLSSSNVSMLIRGIRSHVHGWCVDRIPDDFQYEDNTVYRFYHHEGSIRDMTIAQFKQDIYRSSKVNELVSGKRNSVCGWTMSPETKVRKVGGRDQTVYTFFNHKTRAEFVGTRKEFEDVYGLNKQRINAIVNNGTITKCMWCVIYSDEDYTLDESRGKAKGDATQYLFMCVSSGEEFHGTKNELRSHTGKYGFKFSRMLDGKNSLDWTIISSD